MIAAYFRRLYRHTMDQAYGHAHQEIIGALNTGGECLDCGANGGYWFNTLSQEIGLSPARYHGIEWSEPSARSAQAAGINVIHGDLNKPMPFDSNKFRCIFGLSVLEHLLHPCRFLAESYRTLEPGGKLILLTPNISTYFTAALILAGKMPSSGPHPDSSALLKSEELFKVSHESLQSDADIDTPEHRHLVVFSYLVLKRYLTLLGFRQISGHGFGLYPFPIFMQPLLQAIDPYHCHQMVFVATK